MILVREVKRQGRYVIDDPDLTREAAHKGILYRRLMGNGVPVPETVVVPRSDIEGFKLDDKTKPGSALPTR